MNISDGVKRSGIKQIKIRLRRIKQLVDTKNLLFTENAEVIKYFEDYCFSERFEEARIDKYAQSLRKITEWLGKSARFEQATKKDIERLIKRLEHNRYSARRAKFFKVENT
jgi:hypothetical protein